MFVKIVTLALLMAILISGISQAYTGFQKRQWLQVLHDKRVAFSKMEEDQGKLQLEIGAWSVPGYIEMIARQELNMVFPEIDNVILIKD